MTDTRGIDTRRMRSWIGEVVLTHKSKPPLKPTVQVGGFDRAQALEQICLLFKKQMDEGYEIYSERLTIIGNETAMLTETEVVGMMIQAMQE